MNDSIRTRGSRFAGWAACVGLVTLATVPAHAQPAGITPQERAILDLMSPLPDLPPDPTNRYADDPAAALIGQKLFFETRYSGAIRDPDDGTNGGLGIVGETGRSGCAVCHVPSTGFADRRATPGNVSLAVRWQTRNTPSLINGAYYDWFGWAGQQSSQWTQASQSPESGRNTRGTRLGFAHMLWDYYRDEYAAVFGEALPDALDASHAGAARFPLAGKPGDDSWNAMDPADQLIINQIMANQAKAVAAYERKLISRNAPFDQFIAGNDDAISAAAKRGAALFVGKAGCVACHSGPFFADQKFHNLGVPQTPFNVRMPDIGRIRDIDRALGHPFNTLSEFSDDTDAGCILLCDLTATEADRGKFKTSGLRNVAQTAPYMHTGGFATLRDVVDFYDAGGGTSDFVGQKDPLIRPLNLSEGEKDDLVAFLESLTGEPIPAALTIDPHQRPTLVRIQGGVGAEGTFISPLGDAIGFTEFTITLSEAADFSSAVLAWTGAEADKPSVVDFVSEGNGVYRVVFDRALTPGYWAKIHLNVTSSTTNLSGRAVLWVAHHPDDVNQDGSVDIRDATAFGVEFAGRADVSLIDLNGDGTVDVGDSTAFGDIWRGDGASRTWRGSQLPTKPE